MSIVSNYFDDLFLEDADFGEPNWEGADLIVPVFGAIVLEAHPLGQGRRAWINGRLRFCGVVSSTRLQAEYLGDPKVDGFRESVSVVEHPPVPPPEGPTQTFGFSGVLLHPLAFVDWEVECARFELVEWNSPETHVPESSGGA